MAIMIFRLRLMTKKLELLLKLNMPMTLILMLNAGKH